MVPVPTIRPTLSSYRRSGTGHKMTPRRGPRQTRAGPPAVRPKHNPISVPTRYCSIDDILETNSVDPMAWAMVLVMVLVTVVVFIYFAMIAGLALWLCIMVLRSLGSWAWDACRGFWPVGWDWDVSGSVRPSWEDCWALAYSVAGNNLDLYIDRFRRDRDLLVVWIAIAAYTLLIRWFYLRGLDWTGLMGDWRR
ncbi:hypothetical protein F5Y10DRAFT_62136 [Nemania abortiva]|nr:hypothetical protein F5Y10DRAFT_62136 [Nemania abortiva]